MRQVKTIIFMLFAISCFAQNKVIGVSTYLRSEPNMSSERIGYLWRGSKVAVSEVSEDFTKITYNGGQIGYVLNTAMLTTEDKALESGIAIKEFSLDEPGNIIATPEERRQAEYDRLVNRFDEETAKRIQKGEIWIGMSEDMLHASWGRPDDENRTVTQHGTDKQKIYERKGRNYYVYTENGKVTAWQER